ncbi:MAG TPA: hypothetical protein VL523_12790 [Terriglobia bacterium]|nr:hypothetical protein [Terriglobia bacterium]
MRVRVVALLGVALMAGLAGAASAQAKQGPVAGTWACVAHGTGNGDMEYTFNLKQAAAEVTGNFTAPSPDGTPTKHEVKSGSFRAGKLALHFDDDNGTIDVTGGVSGKDAMKGDWTQGEAGGTWECKRGTAAATSKP